MCSAPSSTEWRRRVPDITGNITDRITRFTRRATCFRRRSSLTTLDNRFFPVRSVVCFLIEGGIVIVSVILSYMILKEVGGSVSIGFGDAILRGIAIAIICQGSMYLLDLYDLEIHLTSGQLVFSILYSTGFVCVGIGIIGYLFPEIGIPGNFYLLALFFTVIFLVLWRTVFDLYLTRFGRMQNLLIIGSENITAEIGKEITAREKLGFRLGGYINRGPGSRNRKLSQVPLPRELRRYRPGRTGSGCGEDHRRHHRAKGRVSGGKSSRSSHFRRENPRMAGIS